MRPCPLLPLDSRPAYGWSAYEWNDAAHSPNDLFGILCAGNSDPGLLGWACLVGKSSFLFGSACHERSILNAARPSPVGQTRRRVSRFAGKTQPAGLVVVSVEVGRLSAGTHPTHGAVFADMYLDAQTKSYTAAAQRYAALKSQLEQLQVRLEVETA